MGLLDDGIVELLVLNPLELAVARRNLDSIVGQHCVGELGIRSMVPIVMWNGDLRTLHLRGTTFPSSKRYDAVIEGGEVRLLSVRPPHRSSRVRRQR
jgi:hypothetical protein